MVQQIKLYLQATPFRPFAIHCRGVGAFGIDHPGNASIWRNGVLVGLPDAENALALSSVQITDVVGQDLLAA
jgi:hypothetical protein